jgi:hypothetical protein
MVLGAVGVGFCCCLLLLRVSFSGSCFSLYVCGEFQSVRLPYGTPLELEELVFFLDCEVNSVCTETQIFVVWGELLNNWEELQGIWEELRGRIIFWVD